MTTGTVWHDTGGEWNPDTLTLRRAERTVRMAHKSGQSKGGNQHAEPAKERAISSTLPAIDASIQDLGEISRRAWDALEKANDPPYLFRHGCLPCRIERDDDGAPIIRILTPDRLRHELARRVRWYVSSKQNGVEIKKDAKPPMDVVKNMLATADIPLPILSRIVETPVFAPDGSIQTFVGYHPNTMTYYNAVDGFALPDIPKTPSTDHIRYAKEIILDDFLQDFKFVAEADRSHAVALLLLPFVRDMIVGPTPNHLIESPTPGSGKGLLADVVLRPALGRKIGTIAQARDGDEWRKRLTARLR